MVRLKSIEGYQVFHIGGQEYTINPNFMVGDMIAEIVKKTNQDIYNIEFYDKDFILYHSSSPMFVIAQESFYVKINNSERYLVLNFEDDDVIDLGASNQKEFQVGNILNSLGTTPMKKNILSNFVTEISNELLKVKDVNGNVSMGVLASLIRLKVQKDAFNAKNNGQLINIILESLQDKRNAMDKLKEERITDLKSKSKFRIKCLYSLIGF